MPAGLHLTMLRLDQQSCRPFSYWRANADGWRPSKRIWLANAGGSTWHALQALAGSNPATGPSNGFSNLSSIVVASAESLRRMQEELHLICGFRFESGSCLHGCDSSTWLEQQNVSPPIVAAGAGGRIMNHYAANAASCQN
jgi:hypothetical protein